MLYIVLEEKCASAAGFLSNHPDEVKAYFKRAKRVCSISQVIISVIYIHIYIYINIYIHTYMYDLFKSIYIHIMMIVYGCASFNSWIPLRFVQALKCVCKKLHHRRLQNSGWIKTCFGEQGQTHEIAATGMTMGIIGK